MKDETQRHFTVEVRDDHDGGSVWIVDEDYMIDREEADELAERRSRQRDNRLARVRVNDSRVDAEFHDGKQEKVLPPVIGARREKLERQLLAYALRGCKASGLVPEEDGRGVWESLDESTQLQWRALAAQVFHSVESLRRMETGHLGEDSPAVRDRVLLWEGSAQGLAESLGRLLDVEELAALSGEVALVWRQKVHAIRCPPETRSVPDHGKLCAARHGQQCDCGLVFR